MSRRATVAKSGIEKHFDDQLRERQAADERETRKQREIDDGNLADLDALEKIAQIDEGPTSSVRASRGSQNRKTQRKKRAWFCPVVGEGVTPCSSRALCPHTKPIG